ncbi:hypothetical protein FRB95_004657 [Tulasnella sp. JGI-2019a]|nr:hypothetical protein FRB95_004657 [Tulasnella sp. JGI-2019a]
MAAIIVQRKRRLAKTSMWILLIAIWALATCQLVAQFMEWHEAYLVASGPALVYEVYTNFYFPTRK